MGWDISYHPMGSDEIASVYFAGVENPERAKEFAEKYDVVPFHHENLAAAFQRGKDFDGQDFGTGHAFNLAIIAGYLRKYWYVRGSALSFLYEDSEFSPYFSDWDALVPASYQPRSFPNHLTENYCGGVFISHQALQKLKQDMESNASIKEKMEELFSHGRLAVFTAAMNGALEKGLGLLEAAEVIEPFPFDLNNSKSFSNLHNCDPAGALLFQQAALEQIAEAQKQHAETPSKKQGFFSRLFGKK